MTKRFILLILIFLLMGATILIPEAQAKTYYTGTKRKVKKYYYQLQRKPKATVKLNAPILSSGAFFKLRVGRFKNGFFNI